MLVNIRIVGCFAFVATAFVSVGVLCAQNPAAANFTALDTSLFAKFDDGDGALNKDEVGDYPWTRYDADADGSVSKQEFLLGKLKDRLIANLEPNAEKAFSLLDWTNDGKLSGGELDGGVWLSFDRNGDRVVEKAEYIAAKRAAPGNIPDMPKADAPLAWQKHTVDILTFEMPGPAKKIRETADMLEFGVDLDGGEARYRVVIRKFGTDKLDSEALLNRFNDTLIEQMKAEVVGNDKIELDGYPGRDLQLAIPDQLRFRQQGFIAQARLVQADVSGTPNATVTPADVQRFFASLKFAAEASPVPAPAPEVAPVTHAKFVEALAANDHRAVFAMMHPQLQAAVDLALIQVYFDIIRSKMGRVTEKSSDDLESKSKDVDGIKYLETGDVVTYVNGPAQVSTTIAEGRLSGFLIEAPQLTPKTIGIETWNYLNALGDESKDFAESFAPQCEKFVNVLFDQGADQAFALLDPRIQDEFKTKGEPGRLTKLRAEFGKISKLEVAKFRVEGAPDRGLDEFKITFEATRPGKPAAEVEFSFAVDGLRAVIIGYEFRDEIAPPPPGESPVAPPRAPGPIAPPRTSSVPAPPRTSAAPPAAPPAAPIP